MVTPSDTLADKLAELEREAADLDATRSRLLRRVEAELSGLVGRWLVLPGDDPDETRDGRRAQVISVGMYSNVAEVFLCVRPMRRDGRGFLAPEEDPDQPRRGLHRRDDVVRARTARWCEPPNPMPADVEPSLRALRQLPVPR